MQGKLFVIIGSLIILCVACAIFLAILPYPETEHPTDISDQLYTQVAASNSPVPATPVPTITEKADISIDVTYIFVDESPAPEKFTIGRIEYSSGELEDILRLEAQKAADMGREPYVEFYADWCPPCKAIRESISDERMIDAYEGTYIIQLDLDEWGKKLSGTGFYVPGIPAFYEIDADGRPTGRMITGGAWGEDIPENIAPPMKAFFNGEEAE